jgi:hypothetical protein
MPTGEMRRCTVKATVIALTDRLSETQVVRWVRLPERDGLHLVCSECDAPAPVWMVYAYADEAMVMLDEWHHASWVCETCKPSVIAQCRRNGWRVIDEGDDDAARPSA